MRFKLICAALFLVAWAWAAWNPLFRDAWLLENILIFIFVPVIVISGFYLKLSNASYALLTIFMTLHVIGSHYTYDHVPFGFTLQDWFNSTRNMYDRVVHFSFGFLLAYPIREVFVRIGKTKGFWSYYFPFDLVLAFSAGYEIIEWLTAAIVDPGAGLAFLGSQGDVWDAQKDMLVAGLGALIAMLIIAVINSLLDPEFWKEMKESFSIPKNDHPLGEVKLRRLLRLRSRD